MTPHDLLAAFETLAEAPDGVTRLRELVLQLAVRGKLVPQDPNDEPACMLLERIAAEKARLVKEGKILKARPLPLVSADEVPFAVPEGWMWARMDEVCDIVSGVTKGRKLYGQEIAPFPYLRVANVQADHLDLSVVKEIEIPLDELEQYRLIPGDVLLTEGGDWDKLGRSAIWFGEIENCIHQNHIFRARSLDRRLLPRWVSMFTNSPDGRTYFQFCSKQTTNLASINKTQLRSCSLPVPPAAEQHRIVAKVDALMALLDRLETARSEQETTRAALRNATLATLRDAADAEAVEAAWTRIAERIDDLFTDPADVAPLRQTILQLAVRGKLVPQDPNDEPACVLLERIAAEKTRLVQEGKLPKSKPLPPVGEDDMPFEVPSRWEYVRLNDLLIEDSRNGLSTQPNQGPPGIEILRISAGTARNDAVVMEEDRRFLELEEEAILTYELQRGDLLACRFNGNLHYVGRVAVYEKYSGHRQVYPDKLIRFRVHQSLINPWYIRFAMNCQGIRSVVERMCATTAGNIGISATNLKTVAIPIPPFEEQRRIVAKVDSLMTLCDALAARLAAAREAQAAFAAAAVYHLDT